MMKRRDEVLVGLFTLAAIAVLVMSMLWLARGGLSSGYPIYARFEWGAGLKQGQPVLFSGVNVGFVDRVDLLPNGGLVTTMRIYKSQQVPTGTRAQIAPNGIFGDMMIALRASDPTGAMLAPGDTISSDESGAQLGDVLARVDSVGRNLQALTKAMNTQFGEQNGFAEMRATITTANQVLVSLDRVVAQQAAELTKTQAAIQRAVSAVDSTAIDSTLRSMRGAAASTAQLAEDLRATSARLNSVMAKLETGNGSAALLLNDRALYDEVVTLVRRIDTLTVEFKANPRKFIKLSIF
jgi:phospholipid/cholesterol/gamma-HCH transport system substrate-binding protein